MWQKILKQRDRPFYVEEVEGGKVLRLEGYDTTNNNNFPTKVILLPQEGGNPLAEKSYSAQKNKYVAKHTDAAIEKSIGFLNSIINLQTSHITDILIDGNFPYASLKIQIISKSQERYKIRIYNGLATDKDINVIGEFRDIDVNLCIDAQTELPIGDTLASYIMSLIDDQQSCENIDTLETFVMKDYYVNINCPICDEENTISIQDIDDAHECENCRIAVFSDIEVGANEPGENYLELEYLQTNLYDPETGEGITEINDVANLGGYGDKYFLSEDETEILHMSYPGTYPTAIFRYEAVLDEDGDYHASMGETITVKGDDYKQMSTGLYHKVMTNGSIENEGYDEGELREEEE